MNYEEEEDSIFDTSILLDVVFYPKHERSTSKI